MLLFASVHDLLLSGVAHPLADFYPSVVGRDAARRDLCERFAAEWLRHRGLAWAVDLLPEPQSDPLAGGREDTGQLPLALKDMTP